MTAAEDQSVVRSSRPPLQPGMRLAKRGEVAELRELGLPCPECGEEHIKASGVYTCTGHNAQRKPCGNIPPPGSTTCAQRHGASASNRQEAAARRVRFAEAEGEAARLMREMDLGESQHPLDGLLEVVRHTGAMMRVYSHLVSGLDTDPSETWVTQHGPGGSFKEIRRATSDAIVGFNADGEQVNDVRVAQYERWAGLYMRACKTALDADIDERLVRNATATSNGFFRALNAGLEAAAITPEQREAFSAAMAHELRKMGPGVVLPS